MPRSGPARGRIYTGGSVNYCLNTLAQKGLIKTGNFSKSQNKSRYVYLLTAKGLEQKAKATYHFLRRKMQEYEELKAEIEELRQEVGKNPHLGKN